LVGGEEVCFVDHDRDVPAAFVFLGGEQIGGLRDERGLVEARDGAECGDDAVVEATGADGGVAEVDDRAAGLVQLGEGGADGDGFAGTDLAGDHAEGAFGDAPADAGDGFGVCAVPVQHLRGERPAERCLGEPVVGLQLVDHTDASPSVPVPVPGRINWPGTCPSGRSR